MKKRMNKIIIIFKNSFKNYFIFLIIIFNKKIKLKNIYFNWGLGIGDWGLGIGDW